VGSEGDAGNGPRALLVAALDSHDIAERIRAIEILGEIGDEQVLKQLRERLAVVNKELSALVVAVGKLKRRLKVK
jgi:HEAT repeat protein